MVCYSMVCISRVSRLLDMRTICYANRHFATIQLSMKTRFIYPLCPSIVTSKFVQSVLFLKRTRSTPYTNCACGEYGRGCLCCVGREERDRPKGCYIRNCVRLFRRQETLRRLTRTGRATILISAKRRTRWHGLYQGGHREKGCLTMSEIRTSDGMKL